MSRYPILLLIILQFLGGKLSAQGNYKTNNETFDTTKQTIIDLKNKRVYQTIPLDKDFSFPLKQLPDTMIISYTGDDYLKRRIIFFNKGKNDTLILTWNGSGSNIENLQLSDFSRGEVTLAFAGSELINIGNRENPIKPRSFLHWDTWVTVEPLPTKSTGDETNDVTACEKKLDSPQKILIVDSTQVAKSILCILCNSFPKCNDSLGCPTNEEKHAGFSSLSNQHRRLFGNAQTKGDMYLCVYDVTGTVEWYKNSENPTNRISDISTIKPKAWSEMTFIIRGNQEDEDYIVTADGQTYFMTDSTLQGTLTDNYETVGEKAAGIKTEQGNAILLTDTTATKEIVNSLVEIMKKTEQFINLPVTIDSSINILDTSKSLISFPKDKTNKKRQQLFKTEFNRKIIPFAEEWIQKHKPIETSQNKPTELQWKGKLMALDKVLENFNHQYSNIDFREPEYRKQLLIIQQGIMNCLSIPATSNPNDLRKALEIILCSEVSKANIKDARELIESITSEYKSAISKTTTRKRYSKTIQIPDADDVKVNITSKKSNAPILERSFHIRGGWKIDFSSGIFYNGLGTGDFILSQSTFKYLETTDSFFISNGVQIDSVRYTGKVLDTTGNFIKYNNSRINYGAGFFIHIYKRSGNAFDIGAGVGFQINNSGQALLMIGISPMIHAGSSRISLIGGITLGKRTYISAAAKPYLYQSYYKNYDQASTIQGVNVFKNRSELPRFYDSGTNLKADTYDKIGFGLFGGITFNFASFSLSKK